MGTLVSYAYPVVREQRPPIVIGRDARRDTDNRYMLSRIGVHVVVSTCCLEIDP